MSVSYRKRRKKGLGKYELSRFSRTPNVFCGAQGDLNTPCCNILLRSIKEYFMA